MRTFGAMVQGELLLLLAAHLVLTALPGVSASLYVASRGERRIPVLLAVLLVGSGAVAMVGFFAYYESHPLGQTWSILALFGPLLATVWLLLERRIPRRVLGGLATPLALWALGSAFLVFLGFLHGGTHSPLAVSLTRFSGPLPTDDDIPRFFAEWFYAHGHKGTPPEFPGNWLASDRPPLQVGYVLDQQPFHLNRDELNYQVLGVCLQQLWIVGLWALLVALPVGRVTKALTMITLLVSDLAIVNGFYVWPKLLAAAMLLAAAALVITALWDEVRGRLWGGALVAALCGLAMMGHGSSVYGILAIAAIAAFRGLPSWRWLGVAVLALIVVMAPWSAYQKWGDPPGNRLTKWYLGGDVGPDKKSVSEAIRDGYGEAGLGGTLHKKGQNFVAIFGGKAMATNLRESREAIGRGDFEGAVRPVRSIFFFNLVPSLGLLLLGPVAMAIGWRRRRPEDWKAAAVLLAIFAVGLVLWALIQFGGSTAQTVIHQGSYLLPALGLAGCAIGLRAVWPRFAIGWLALNAVLMLVIYVPAFEPVEGSAFTPANAVLALLALAAFAVVAFGRPPRAAHP
ncbi:MAG TPA: hypothetical protein VIJ21_10400 [Solirubrobacterales bacterium]